MKNISQEVTAATFSLIHFFIYVFMPFCSNSFLDSFKLNFSSNYLIYSFTYMFLFLFLLADFQLFFKNCEKLEADQFSHLVFFGYKQIRQAKGIYICVFFIYSVIHPFIYSFFQSFILFIHLSILLPINPFIH